VHHMTVSVKHTGLDGSAVDRVHRTDNSTPLVGSSVRGVHQTVSQSILDGADGHGMHLGSMPGSLGPRAREPRPACPPQPARAGASPA